MLSLSTILTGLLTLFGLIGETSPTNDSGTTGVVLFTAFIIMFAVSALALVAVTIRASWARNPDHHRRGASAGPEPSQSVIDPKDVVLATMGAAAALAGFVLVFLGVIIAAYQSYAGNAPAAVVSPFRTAGMALFGTFAFSLVTVLLCLLWLVLGGPMWLYGFTLALFVIQLVVVFLAAGWTTRMVLWP